MCQINSAHPRSHPQQAKGQEIFWSLVHYAPVWLLLQPLAFPVLWGVLVIPYSYSQVPGWFLDGSPSRGSKGPSQSPWKCPVRLEGDLDLCVKVLHGRAEPRQHHPPSQLQAQGCGKSHFPSFSKLNPRVVWVTNTARAKVVLLCLQKC